ncbi:hypothetical protein [Streptomyces cylindrosporus]|uniref:Uncharacterized protein n=1 Tax=Streptomyces cylindrosporus TaxID=2927583 RepID=A0ABS9YN26_9ACTN|nr:hypothetical protein [Streptomyces cylindrosporus]MCI3278574.1 hypothetical protein [Streptomyces cylindrosporus]
MTAVEAGVAVAVTAPVVFGVRGLPEGDGFKVALLLLLAGISALFGLLAGTTRSNWLGGEKREFESALPLTDPDAVLPTPRESLRRGFDAGFVVILAVPSLALGLLWDPWAVGWAALFAPERIAKGVCLIFWERRHGIRLWRGRVAEQPLGKGQFLYSSAAVAVTSFGSASGSGA